MLTRITLKNFQKHKKLSLDLEQITTIIGPSDAGKSAVLRAFRWLCLSRPAGSEFIRKGSRICRVTLDASEHWISRTKSNSENTYIVQDKESATEKSEVYKALKGTVPEEIANILNVDEINFQKQMDGPFWLNLTPGEIGRELNSLMNLEKMDSLLAHIASQLRLHQTQETLLSEDEAQTERRLNSLDWLEEAEAINAEIEKLSDTTHTTSDSIERLEFLLDKIENLERKRNLSVSQEEIDAVIRLDVQVKQLATSARTLSRLCCKLEEMLEQKESWESKAKDLKEQIQERMKDGCPVCGNPTPSLSLSPICT